MRTSAIHAFLQFCKKMKASYKKVNYIHMCWYIEHMAQQGLTTGTITNHISHIRTYYKLAELPDAALYHYRVRLALRAIAMTIRVPSKAKEDVPPTILKRALQLNAGHPEELATNLAFLIMYVGFLRQSSVAPATVGRFDPTRHLTHGDITIAPKGINLVVSWSKTLQRSSDAKTLLLPATKDPTLCPRRAYKAYMKATPRAPAAAPLLTFKDGNPLTIRFLARRWAALMKAAIAKTGIYSLHSLRKGGASFAYNVGGAKLTDVMTQGTWRSSAVRAYIKPHVGQATSVQKALAKL